MTGKTVLIVDDSEESRYLLRVLLQGHGYQTEEACNGEQALELARQSPPDLIVTDILMPVMDGFALCRAWKRDVRLGGIPFIFYTATYTDERDRAFALSLGAERFVVKPEEPEALFEIIQETILQRRDAEGEMGSGDRSSAKEKGREEADSAYLERYNETLIRKLESKIEELAQDIAARQQVEEALGQSEMRFRALVEAAPEGIFVQADERFVYLNPAMLSLLGAISADELLGTDLMERIAPEYHAAVRRRLSRLCELGGPAPLMEQEYIRMDGSRVPVETTSVAIEYEGREACVVFIRDITERKSAEREQARLQSQLAQAQKMESVGRLAGSIAHDYNNMLTVMLGHLDLALSQAEPGTSLHADLQEVLKAAQRSADLTHQLLAFARKQAVRTQVLDLNTAVENMLSMLQRLIGEEVRLLWVPAADLWPIKADVSQIDQILINLCVNARDAITGIGEIAIQTENCTLDEVYCAQMLGSTPGDYVLLTVSDNGSGMDQETQSHLFEPFFTTKPPGRGTGLGLATVYGIVKQNNGLINVYSEVGHGTTFRIYLPRDAQDAAQPAGERSLEAPRRGKETVLLVEDEAAILRLVHTVLERAGYTVLVAETPGAAIELAKEHADAIDLLITDMVMPEMNGRELAEKLRSLYPRLKRIFTSGYTANVIADRRGGDEGVVFLQKPFSPQVLLTQVRAVLDRG